MRHVALISVGLLAACGGREATDGSGGRTGGRPHSTGAGTESATGTGETAGGTASEDGGGERLDLAPERDGGIMQCHQALGEYEFKIIWIANTAEGTVSKIDTETGVELGRYATSGKPNPSPSRTAVNLIGEVAVLNRGDGTGGSVVKIAADLDRCEDRNGDGAIQTSTGRDDVLPWGTDECVSWSIDVPSPNYQAGPRPVAWEPTPDDFFEDCLGSPELWIGWLDENETAHFWRLDGTDGARIAEVQYPNWITGARTGMGVPYGPYGGAATADGKVWISGVGKGASAIRIDVDSLTYEDFTHAGRNGYGIALDKDGSPWVAGMNGTVWAFDESARDWQLVADASSATGDGIHRGVAIDRDGVAWVASHGNANRTAPCRLIKFDAATRTLIDGNVPLPGCSTPVGVSIDADGYVWVVDRGANSAYKVHPVTHAVELTFADLNSPYTYSDMTGAGLNLVVNPPG